MNPSRSAVLIALIALAAGLAPVHAAPRTVLSSDFEDASPASPPQGWTMWGAERYKDPANYTIDTAGPHGGRACFRIHHPADTGGYIVSAPQRAVCPVPGGVYRVSFWARSGSPGVSSFGITAYRSISPFVDAPSPGWHRIEVGTDWRPFAFTYREGWDLFADDHRYLLLTFRAATSDKEERTLWIDDVEVTETVGNPDDRLLRPSELHYAPLQHRLSPGSALSFTLDPARRIGPATPMAGGISFHRVAGWTGQPYDRQGRYSLDPAIEQAIGELRLPMTRFYGVGDEPFGLDASIDRAAAVCRKVGVPLERTVLELETQSAETALPPEVWAQAVRHSKEKGYGFSLWEISNEPYADLWGGKTAFATPEDYVDHVRAVSAAIRRADPSAQVGIDIAGSDLRWGNRVLKEAAGAYDFVAPHYYDSVNVRTTPFEDVVLTSNYAVLDRALQVGALLRAYNPGREVYQLETEWGLAGMGPNGEPADDVDRNANIMGTAYRAVRLIYYAREGMLRGASSWQMLNRLGAQGFAVLAQEAPQKRSMLYWLYYYFNRHVSEYALDTPGTAPWYGPSAGKPAGPLTPVLATLSADGAGIYLMIANGSWTQAVPCTVALHGFAVAHARGVVLCSDDLDGKPFIEKKGDFVRDLPLKLDADRLTCTIPAHSVVFVTIERDAR
jgi:hypothetical protein